MQIRIERHPCRSTLHDLSKKCIGSRAGTCGILLHVCLFMITRRNRSAIFARFGVLLALVGSFLFAGRVEGIILYRTADPAANTTAPTGTLANSGWQYEGIFGDYLGTPIAPHFFITAQHIGPNSDKLVYRGADYTIVNSFDDPGTDLRIFQVSQTFTSFRAALHR